MKSISRKGTQTALAILILLNSFQGVFAQTYIAPQPILSLREIRPTLAYQPAMLCGVKFFSKQPEKFEFIFSHGEESYSLEKQREFSQRAIDCFLTVLAMPQGKLWVNLSPYEANRVIEEKLAKTYLGKVLLESDYTLKQFCASLSDPKTELGRKFWKTLKEKSISAGTFNKVWITPSQAVITEYSDTALVNSVVLDVKLDDGVNPAAAAIMREMILPVIHQEVNHGRHFAQLRQACQAFVLAAWFKRRLEDNIWNKIYSSKEKLAGIDKNDPQIKEKVYADYLRLCNDGVYNYTEKTRDFVSKKITTRTYFSGGIGLDTDKINLVVEKRSLIFKPGWSARVDFKAVTKPVSKPTGAQKPKIKMLLVYPRLPDQKFEPTRWPAGLMSMAAAVSDKDFLNKFCARNNDARFNDTAVTPDVDVKILDMQAAPKDFDFQSFLREQKFDIVGLGAVTAGVLSAQALAKTIKEITPEAITIIGAHHVSALPQETMQNQYLDWGVVGEGEEAMAEVVMHLANGYKDFSDIAGVIKQNGALESLERRKPIMNINDYPMASKALKQMLFRDGYAVQRTPDGRSLGRMGVIVTSRGCPNNCTFCASGVVSPHGKENLRCRSAESVFAEMKDLWEQGVTSIYALDDVFMPDRAELVKLADLLEQERNTGMNMNLAIFTRADMIDEETAVILKRMNCGMVSLGVEVGDENVLGNTAKNIRLAQVSAATQTLKKHGIMAKWFMMVGLNGWGSVLNTAKFILKEQPAAIDVSQLVPYPGTKIYKDMIEGRGFIKLTDGATFNDFRHGAEPDNGKDPQSKGSRGVKAIVNTKYMQSVEIEEARRILFDIFFNRNDQEKLQTLMAALEEKAARYRSAHASSTTPVGGVELDAGKIALTLKETARCAMSPTINTNGVLEGIVATVQYIKGI